MKNDGWNSLDYHFGNDEELNQRLSALLNELCHVFHYHADGNWKNHDKPKYAQQLAIEIKQRPSLIRKLLKLRDPVISNVTYAAIDLNKQVS